MSMFAKDSVLSRFEKLQSLKKTEVFCPTSRIRLLIKPLTVGDDLTMKTMASSPELYDFELNNLLYTHSTFPDLEKRPTFQDFCAMLSIFDKSSMLWGLYNATYNDFGTVTEMCPNCGTENTFNISAQEILHDDFAQIWDQPVEFYNFQIPVEIDIGDNEYIKKIIFNCRIPSVNDNLKILKYIGAAKLKDNYEKYNSLLSVTDNVVLITKSIDILYDVEVSPPAEEVEAKSADETTVPATSTKKTKNKASITKREMRETTSDQISIYKIVDNYLSADYAQKIVLEFNTFVQKYSPRFYKKTECSNCSHVIETDVNLEVSLFKKFFRV